MASNSETFTNEKTENIDSRKEIINAIDAIAKRSGISRDKAITAWYATTFLGIDEVDAIDAATVDGPEDNGCDFIFVDSDHETVVILQGYISDRTARVASLRKWNALVSSIANIKDPISFEHGGRSDIYARLKDVDISNYYLSFGLVTLAAKSEKICRQKESVERSGVYGSKVSFFYEYQESLHDTFLAIRASDRNVPEDTLTFSSNVAVVKGEFGIAIVGSTLASELSRLHKKYNNQLFEGNIRFFIGERKGGINEKIVETARSRPGDFWALNNGITIVADDYEYISESTYKIRKFSIVNGCQSTVSLSKAVSQTNDASKAQVLVKLIAAKRALLTDIVRYNNTQNPVKLSSVRLLDPIQESLRAAFDSIGYMYAPKQEGAKIAKKPNRIDLDQITQYLAAMSDDTILEAVAKKRELFDRSYSTIFPRGLRTEKVMLAWLLAQEVELARTNLLENYINTTDLVMKAILGIHGTPWGIYVANYLITNSGSDLSKLNLQSMTTDAFKGALKKYADSAFKEYSEIATNILITGEDTFTARNELRTKAFLEKLKKNLNIRMARKSLPKLPKLNSVS